MFPDVLKFSIWKQEPTEHSVSVQDNGKQGGALFVRGV